MSEQKILVLDEVLSTQDAAIDHNLQAGDACVSWNQSDGRGRRGHAWDSSGGVAVTVVLDQQMPHLPIAIAATLASQLNNILPTHSVGIKWPNDIFVEGKKLAGILIEQRDWRILVGVGVNVYEAPIDGSVSLSELGYEVTKDDIAMLVISSVLDGAQLDEIAAVMSWEKRDIVVGSMQTVQSGDNRVEGLVLDIDPCQNLILETSGGIFTLPAASSSIVN